MVVVGIWLTPQKLKELRLTEEIFHKKWDDIQFVLIDLDEPLDEQGPFHLIVHRISDLLKKDDEANRRRFKNFSSYIEVHPEIELSDDIETQMSFHNRETQVRVNENCVQKDNLEGRAFVPPWTILKTNDPNEAIKQLEKDNVSFPIICKSTFGQSHTSAHDMCILFNQESLSQLNVPCIAQTFVNHNAKLIKIYTLGPYSFIFNRDSIKNLYPGDSKAVYFHTYDIFKGKSKSKITQVDVLEESHELDQDFLMKLGQACRECSGLDLSGADVIIDCKSGKYALLDLNVFPSFFEIDFFHYFLLYIKWRLNIS